LRIHTGGVQHRLADDVRRVEFVEKVFDKERQIPLIVRSIYTNTSIENTKAFLLQVWIACR
jgi:hypothetical protein